MKFLRCWLYRIPLLLPGTVSLQSLDSWGTSEDADAPAKRHSTSDLSDATFSDIRREGWLHYKQVLTKKGKVSGRKGGVGGRPNWSSAHPPPRSTEKQQELQPRGRDWGELSRDPKNSRQRDQPEK